MTTLEFKSLLVDAKVIVVKVGSSLVTNDGNGLDKLAIAAWATQIANLVAQGKQVILVSSGAVAEGMQRLGWKKRPTAVNELQAAAAVGQMGLVQMYESCFSQHQLHTAQLLLTHDDLADRKRYLNARSTLRTLLDCSGPMRCQRTWLGSCGCLIRISCTRFSPKTSCPASIAC